MTNVTIAAMIGGWELLVIAVVLLFPIAAVVFGLAVFLILRSRSKHKAAAPAAPPVISTQRLSRTCPKCGAGLKPDVPEGLCPSCLLKQGIATEGAGPAGQTPFIPPTIAELTRLFPQLEILEPIGKGGMGAVYKARQAGLDRFVALKILAPRSGGDLDFESRFSREARALARLNHPNIVAVYDFGQVQRPSSVPPAAAPAVDAPPQPLNYFIMEFVDGPNLRQIEQGGKLSPREALQIIPQICVALQFAHDEGIVHRDIKPENVLLDKKGRVKIADFGLAKILGTEQQDLRLTGLKDVMGTPHYMAPEQVETPQEVDHRADIYSLGVVFYEMLTGELPLGKFQPPSKRVQVDVRLDEVVLRALEKEPALRYQQASALRTQVETIAATSGTMAEPPVQERKSSMSGKKTMWIAIGIGATCLALVVAVPAIIYTLVQSSVRSELETVKKAQANELTRLGWRVWNGQHSGRATQAVWQDESGRTLTQATQFFQRAVELDPKNADAWNGLGWATFNSGNGQEGEKAFQKVLELEPEHPAALNGLGQIYLSQKKYVEAETYLLKAAPNAPAAWYGLARIHLLQGKFDQAREWAQKVVDSGQADDTAKQMLEAAKAKQLNPQLRMVLEPR